jgi:hypothetical protein
MKNKIPKGSPSTQEFWRETNSHIASLENSIELKNKIIESLENKIASLKTEINNNPPKQSFHDLLRAKIRNTGIISVGKCSDESKGAYFFKESARWIIVKRDNTEIHFYFEENMENLESIQVWEDVIQVVDTKRIF